MGVINIDVLSYSGYRFYRFAELFKDEGDFVVVFGDYLFVLMDICGLHLHNNL